ncbi:50S ribosomal protein L3 [Candidatus Falkowbacteria bacterium]|nr:50S ribosomal protein L3 [Candidatus Falkowbacteria bacterium]
MKFILAEKKEMTQKFTEDGTVIPVTEVTAGHCIVVQVKDADKKDGYAAIQLGFGEKKKISKSLSGHLKKLGNFKVLKEFRIPAEEVAKFKIGEKITVRTFQPGDKVKVTGDSKGKGFQGVVKRWGFHGSPASHGHKDQLRMPGSIGATGPAHVFKGTKMGGRLGGSQVTVANLEIIEIDQDNDTIFIKGALPGARNNLVLISGPGDIIFDEVKSQEDKKPEPKLAESIETVETKKKERAEEEIEPSLEGIKKTKAESAKVKKSAENDKDKK